MMLTVVMVISNVPSGSPNHGVCCSVNCSSEEKIIPTITAFSGSTMLRSTAMNRLSRSATSGAGSSKELASCFSHRLTLSVIESSWCPAGGTYFPSSSVARWAMPSTGHRRPTPS